MAVLTDLQRRIIGHLAIPVNVQALTTHVHPHALIYNDEGEGRPITADEIDKFLRGTAVTQGWAHKFTPEANSASLASAAQAHKDTIPLADEQAQLFEQRRKPWTKHGWKVTGDTWMLTNEGLEAIKAPIPVNRGPLTPPEIQGVVESEWARTLKEPYDETKHKLSEMLTLDGFKAWFQVTADACEKTWGEGSRPTAPVAGGSSGYTDAYEISLLDAENQKTALGATAAPWYMGLSILALNDTDTGTTIADGSHIPTYTGWARQPVAAADMNAGAGTSGSVTNANAIIFAACTAGSSTILAGGNCVQLASGGVLRKWGDIGSTAISITQTPPQLAVGAYTTTTN